MGTTVSKSTYQSEQSNVTKIFEKAVSTNTGPGYSDARNEIESVINIYSSYEIPLSDYPEGVKRVVSLFPIVSGLTQQHVTIQILYASPATNPESNYMVHLSLIPGPQNQAITLIPHQTEYKEVLDGTELYDNNNMNTLSTITRKKKCKPVKCRPKCGCEDYYDESGYY